MNIKNIVIGASATAFAALAGGLIIKHVSDKNEAEQKTAFEHVNDVEATHEPDENQSEYDAMHKRACDTADVTTAIQQRATDIGTEALDMLTDMTTNKGGRDDEKLTQWKAELKELNEKIDSLSDEDLKAVDKVFPNFVKYAKNHLESAERWIGMIEDEKEA